MVIFTNNALRKMASLGLSEGSVLNIYNKGDKEKSNIGGYNSIMKFPGYEIGVYYNQGNDGKWRIISVWKRGRR